MPLPAQVLRCAVRAHEARAAGERGGGAARDGGPRDVHPPCAASRLRRLVPRGRQGLGGVGRPGTFKAKCKVLTHKPSGSHIQSSDCAGWYPEVSKASDARVRSTPDHEVDMKPSGIYHLNVVKIDQYCAGWYPQVGKASEAWHARVHS